MNYKWNMTSEQKEIYTNIVVNAIKRIESKEEDEISFHDTDITPMYLCDILENLGYECDDMDSNGWKMEFCIYFIKDGCTPITVAGCGMTFDVCIHETDYCVNDGKDVDELIKEVQRMID